VGGEDRRERRLWLVHRVEAAAPGLVKRQIRPAIISCRAPMRSRDIGRAKRNIESSSGLLESQRRLEKLWHEVQQFQERSGRVSAVNVCTEKRELDL
jgi:hypothetical protein